MSNTRKLYKRAYQIERLFRTSRVRLSMEESRKLKQELDAIPFAIWAAAYHNLCNRIRNIP